MCSATVTITSGVFLVYLDTLTQSLAFIHDGFLALYQSFNSVKRHEEKRKINRLSVLLD